MAISADTLCVGAALGVGVAAAGFAALLFGLLRVAGLRGRLGRPKAPPASRVWTWAAGLAVFATGTLIFRNPVPALFAAALCVLIPDQLAYQRRRAHRAAVLEQLAVAVRLFAAEFTVAPRLERGLAVVGKRVSDPVGGVFRRAHARLMCGASDEDVFREMARELDFQEGHMFVQLLRAAREQGGTVVSLFHDLASRVTVQQELEKVNRAELFGDRVVGFLLTALLLPLYLLLQVWIPEARDFFADTTAGKAVASLSFLSGIAWFFIDRIVSET